MKRLMAIMNIWMLPLAVLLLLSGCGDNASSSNQAETSGPKVIDVKVLKVEPTPIQDVLILPGETKPWQDVQLAANQVGIIEKLEFKEGDRVKKGDLIAQIDVAGLKAALDNAEADYRLAEDQYQRRLKLYERKIIPAEELDQTRTQKILAAGRLRQIRVSYENGFVYAPFDGVVNHLPLDPGEYLGQGVPVAELVNVEKMKIEVNVPEMDVRYLKPGQNTMVQVDALPELQAVGRIDFVSFKADPATKTFRVRVLVDNSDGKIRAGMIARVAFLKQVIPDAVVAPLFSILNKGGERLVFVEENGTARARAVEIGVIAQNRVQITSGLKPGDNLIVVGQTEVETGTPVKIAGFVDSDQMHVSGPAGADTAGGTGKPDSPAGHASGTGAGKQ